MRAGLQHQLTGLAAMAALSACALQEQSDVTRASEADGSDYLGVTTELLEDDLVNFQVKLQGLRTAKDVEDYAKCAAAQYALIRGYGFARHVRTTVEFEAGIWRGDAVYTVSPALPRGLKTIDAEVTVAACQENRIPTV